MSSNDNNDDWEAELQKLEDAFEVSEEMAKKTDHEEQEVRDAKALARQQKQEALRVETQARKEALRDEYVACEEDEIDISDELIEATTDIVEVEERAAQPKTLSELLQTDNDAVDEPKQTLSGVNEANEPISGDEEEFQLSEELLGLSEEDTEETLNDHSRCHNPIVDDTATDEGNADAVTQQETTMPNAALDVVDIGANEIVDAALCSDAEKEAHKKLAPLGILSGGSSIKTDAENSVETPDQYSAKELSSAEDNSAVVNHSPISNHELEANTVSESNAVEKNAAVSDTMQEHFIDESKENKVESPSKKNSLIGESEINDEESDDNEVGSEQDALQISALKVGHITSNEAATKHKVLDAIDENASQLQQKIAIFMAYAKPVFEKGIKHSFLRAKDAFNEYFGLSLPKRELPLRFAPTTFKKRKELDVPTFSQLAIRKIFSAKGSSPLAIFERTDKELVNLSRMKLSKSKRLVVLDAYSPLLMKKILAIIVSYQKKSSIPDDINRAKMVRLCLSSLRHLMTGYRQVYSVIYEYPNVKYGPSRITANRIAFRLLECVYVEQKLSALLYQRSPGTSILTANKIYNVLALYESDEINFPRKSSVFGVEIDLTAKHIYLHIQTGLMLDWMYFSVKQQRIVFNYLNHNIQSLVIQTAEASSHSRLHWLMPHSRREAPNSTKVIVEEQLPAVMIEVEDFYEQIKADYNECMALLDEKMASHSSPPLTGLKIADVLSVLRVLNTLVKQIENNVPPPIYNAFKPFDISIYSGFKEVYSFYRDMHAARADDRVLKDSLAKRSSIFGGEGDSEENKWLCAAEDENLLVLQTQETKYTVALDVGWLLVIAKESEQILGRIVRLERVDQRINLVIEKIGQNGMNVSFSPWMESADGKKSLLAGVIATKNNQKYLIVPNNDRFWSGREMQINVPGNIKLPVKIDVLTAATHRFQVFAINDA